MEGEGLLKGFCFYGDNAYENDTYMAVPFPNTWYGPEISITIIILKLESTLNAPLVYLQINADSEIPTESTSANPPHKCSCLMLMQTT